MLWIVAATGESLTHEVAEQCRGHNVIAVNDAYKLLPFARVLYAADEAWWTLHKGCPEFVGEKWSTIGGDVKNPVAGKYGINLIESIKGYGMGFCLTPGLIHRGGNSGFQAVNLAITQCKANPVVLVGFDMRGDHFFGKHPPMPRRSDRPHRFATWMQHFTTAAKQLPANIRIINATEGSALTCFPMMSLSEALDAQHR